MRSSTFKRTADVVIALAALIVLVPVLLLVAATVWIRLGTPVLFVQLRPGLDGKPFRMLKFRSMSDARDVQDNVLPDSQRLNDFGKLLRATSLDELPELWNVLVGDMSLVGPRPLLLEYLPLYSEKQKRRHDVRPGLTGLAQVRGRNDITWEAKLDLDVWYVDNWTNGLDWKIVLQTIGGVLRAEGISKSGQDTSNLFRGSQR